MRARMSSSSSSSSSLPATLNPAQLEAVHWLRGPCLVVAGAGSGKTRVITHKIARLLQSGLEPKQIAAITFTNKAAAEMRERARSLVGPRAAAALIVSTFQSLGVRLLREDGASVGLKPRFSILDSDDVLSILRDAGGTTDAAQARRWQWAIGLWKNAGLDAAAAEGAAATDDERVAARVMRRYEERLAAYQAVDFDDLIGLPLKLLDRHDDVRAKWQQRLAHVLVDEVQDTNAVQYELLKRLVGEAARFTAVGDDDQSIYGWRGATIENLKRLPQDFPQLKVVALEQNYRSTGAVLRAANQLIAANPKLYQKKLWSELGEGEPVKVVECDSDEHEATRVVAWLQAQRAQGRPWSDCAVLYRANHQSKVFEQKLRAAEIPYRVSGGQSFFDRAEIRDLLAWLRLVVNNDDDPAFLRAVTTPKRGIGHQTLASLGEFAGKWRTSLFDALFADSLGAVLNARGLGSLHEFGRFVNAFEHRARQAVGRDAAQAALLDLLKDIGYEQHLHDNEDREALAAARWRNVLDFVEWVAGRCGGEVVQVGEVAGEKLSLLDAAQAISLIASLAERDAHSELVALSTLHAAKGLEWPHVWLASVNEGLLPFLGEDEAMQASRLEEERRLMYVGITRARLTLTLGVLRRRKRGREIVAARPSRFIAEMKLDEVRERVDPRERLAALRAQLAARATPSQSE
jgi:ATP-dependent DNA helicase Rep